MDYLVNVNNLRQQNYQINYTDETWIDSNEMIKKGEMNVYIV